MSFPDLGRRVLESVIINYLGDRVEHFDVPGVVGTVVDRLGFVDLDETDPLVLEEIMDQNRKSV